MPNRHNILVVEDELELAKSTLSFLSENGFLPFHAKDLKSARNLLKQEKFKKNFLYFGLSFILITLSIGMNMIRNA